MSITDPEIIISRSKATLEQEERAKEIRRFNQLFVYTPITLLSLISLAIIVLLLYFVINPPNNETYATISGIADAVVIMGVFPLIIISGVLLFLIFSIWVRSRRRGIAPVRGTQKFLWRVSWALDDVYLITKRVTERIANPFISIHAFAAYIRRLFLQLSGLLKRR
jgi:hypothetical protein